MLVPDDLTLVPDLDVVPRSDSAVVTVPTTSHIHLVDLTDEVHRLTFCRFNILQLFYNVNVSSCQKTSKL